MAPLPENVINKLYLISFLDIFAVGLTFPVLSPYIRSLGASHLNAGILSSTYSVLQVISGPIIGSWSDVRGRKSVFIATLVFSLICYFSLGNCTTLLSIFIVRLLLGIFKHTQTLLKATVADVTQTHDNSKIFGKMTAFSSLGFVIGPVVGGHLFEHPNGFMYVCTLTSIIFLTNIVLVYLLPMKVRDTETARNPMSIKNEFKKTVGYLRRVKWSKHWAVFVLQFCYILSTTVFFLNITVHFSQKYNFPQKYVGYGISYISAVGVLVGFLSNWITKVFYSDITNSCIDRALHCFTMLAVSFVGFFVTGSITAFILLLLPYGIANGLLRIILVEFLYMNDNEGERGSLTGASDSVMAMARFMAPLIVGYATDVIGEQSIMILATVAAITGAFVCFYTKYLGDLKMKPL